MKAPHRDDPNAMAIYGVALTVLLKHQATCYPERDPKMVTFADDLTSGDYRHCIVGGRSCYMLARSTDTFRNKARQY